MLVHAGSDSEQLCIVDVDPALAFDKKATPRNDIFADRRTDLSRLRAPGPGETS